MKKTYRYYGMLLVAIFMAIGMAACGDDKDDDDDNGNGNKDPRIANVIPDDMRQRVSQYIPIYDGVNPPNVEGIYIMDPAVTVFDSQYNYDVGHEIVPVHMKFFNQNSRNNTLDYHEKEGDISTAEGKGAFISGDGSNFTIYFNTVSTVPQYSATLKQALVVSGTKTSSGIKNLVYAILFTDKTGDPDNHLVPAGAFRVFKDGDGLAKETSWPDGTRGESFNLEPMPFISSWAPQY